MLESLKRKVALLEQSLEEKEAALDNVCIFINKIIVEAIKSKILIILMNIFYFNI